MKVDLANIQKRLQSRAVLALSLGTNELSVAHLRREPAGVQTAHSFTLPIGSEALLADPEKAGVALAAELERLHIREKRVVVCLPRRWAQIATTDLPEGLADDDLKAMLELRAEREFTTNAAELRLAHHTYPMDGRPMATLAGVPEKRLEALRKMLEAAGLRAVSISLGLDRPARAGAAAPMIQFLANCDHVDLVIAAGGGVTALRTLPGPTTAGFEPSSFLREVRITLGRLPAPVRKEIASARFAGPPENVATLVRETREPLQRLGIAEVEVEPAGTAAPPAVEAGTNFLQEKPVMFELVPRQVKAWQTALSKIDSKRQRWIALAVLGLVVLPIVSLMVRAYLVNSLNAEWQEMRTEVADLEQLQQRIRQFRPWFETTPRAVESLEALASCFPESGEVWAKSTQLAENGKVTCTGFAKSQAAIFALLDRLRAKKGVTAPQLQQVRGENPIQFTIIYQWEAAHAS